MLTQICAELKNYFCLEGDRLIGNFKVENGAITPSFYLASGQYYRVVGSVLNDGVHQQGDILIDEPEFHGAVWLMRVPADVIALAKDISDWQEKFGGVDTQNLSPFQSESFGGYSYTKASGYASSSTGGEPVTWQKVFARRLAPYRRIRTV